ncbi:MAG: hypothetical protein OEL77_04320 [Nitrosopumilus sp.]|nr:hypothetical protein [Nitrosopumilus sp.]MDH3385222.1 hypothetical protein [Nitrosopumilus sp.]
MTLDYTLGSLVGTRHLVLITGMTKQAFPGTSFGIFFGSTRSGRNDVNVNIEKKNDP